jgi:hypothetical protein
MQMQVMHFLPTLGPGVGHDPKSTLRVGPATLLQRQSGRQRHHPTDQRLVLWAKLRHGIDVRLGNHQKMHGCPRIDVVKSEYLLVFIDLATGNLTGRNLTKKAICNRGTS